MTVAIHQPNFLPWMGYFYKISQCDSFVFFDDVEFTKKSFIRRVKIHKPYEGNEEKYLIVPLQKHSDYAHITELKLLQKQNWQRRIKAQIHQSYSKAPCYDQLSPIIDVFFTAKPESESFSKYCSEIILYISELLGIECDWFYSHDMEVQSHKAAANIEIIHQVKGDKYISGMGAKKYQIEGQYKNAGIEMIYSDYPLKFRSLNLPSHFMTKSIISYLAYYEIDFIRERILHQK